MNTVTDDGLSRDERAITELKVPRKIHDDISVEAMPRRIFANAHTYHINSISVNSDDATYLSADDLRVNLWNLEITDQSFSILVHCGQRVNWIVVSVCVLISISNTSTYIYIHVYVTYHSTQIQLL